ncbi:acetyltransferase [Arsenicibacter rosenii]|uniref:PglD N-terminal domain-containing protein n=1 Tax=Arsenicibacter rosenii TaxID=1750698 RepID=A0A1S2VQ13_9BACT|nr:acetyltransferase [Arsenicibacter rosenii]OIN60276.1 hypothetical protein BLX24_05440 [Arsenicibacter rosenii]
MATPIAVYGAGGFGREVLMLIQHINHAYPDTWEPIGVFDDNVPAGRLVKKIPVLGGLSALNQYPTPLSVAIGVGWPMVKKKLVTAITNPMVSFPVLIHPTVLLRPEQDVTLGEGCIICQDTILTVDVSLGSHVLLNLKCTVGHDSRIGDFSSLMPAVHIAGDVMMGDGVFAGTGAIVKNQLTVGNYAVLGAGAVVTKPVFPHTTVKGVPAR